MNILFKSISHILHPLLMPLAGGLIYYCVAPRFIPNEVVTAKAFGLIVLTILIPIVLYFLLKNTGLITTNGIDEANERKIPLLLLVILYIIVIKMVVDIHHYPELYYFFLGVLFSTLCAIFMVMFNIKSSLHIMGISSITMFTIALSIHFGSNLTVLIALLMVINGLLATSRMHCKSYTNTELILGLLFGVIPQLMLANFWL